MGANDWMSAYQGKRIYELLLPGTHDSGTQGYSPASASRTQFYTIEEQLEHGIRVLDMRLSYDPRVDDFVVVHGTELASSKLDFFTTVKWCADFLAANPTETLLMSIKQEGLFVIPDDDFAAKLDAWNDAHVKAGDWKQDLWYTQENSLPTVAEASSSIILLRRYTTVPQPVSPPVFFGGLNINFINDHQSGSFRVVLLPQNPGPDDAGVWVNVQDEYTLGWNDKQVVIEAALDRMRSYDTTDVHWKSWGINFASTVLPLLSSEHINAWLARELAQRVKYYGVLLTDFGQFDLWEQIYELNQL